MKNLDLLKEEIVKCFHCGNETPMKQTGEYDWGSRDEEYGNFDFLFEYKMFACPICHKITLIETYGDETMMKYTKRGEVEWYSEDTVLFPISNIDSDSIPKKVKESFEAALKIKDIDKNVCLMALRHTLELILKDKGATKWGLKEKIEEIAEKGLLPEVLKEASALTKILGDSAAHDKGLQIDEYDVSSMAEFVEYIIEYLYIVPNKIERYKEKLSAKEEIKPEKNT